MSKPLIIIADTDELYLQNLERKFLEEFDDQIELEIISVCVSRRTGEWKHGGFVCKQSV